MKVVASRDVKGAAAARRSRARRRLAAGVRGGGQAGSREVDEGGEGGGHQAAVARARNEIPGQARNDGFLRSQKPFSTFSSLLHLVRHDHKLRQLVRPERRADRHVGGIAPARDQHAADARRVVARVEGVPAPAEVDLEPRREIHRAPVGRHADVAEVTRCSSAPGCSCSDTASRRGA